MRRENGVVSHVEMACESGLPSNFDVSSQMCGSSQPDLSSENVILSNLGAVAYLHEIVQLRAPANDSVAYCGAVYGRVSADLDVVFNNDAAGLADFVVSAVLHWGEAETVAANNDSILDDYAVANLALLPNAHMGMKNHVISENNAGIEHNMRMDRYPSAELASSSNDDVRTNADIRTDLDIPGD